MALNWGRLGDAIPVFNTVKAAVQGNWKDAALDAGTLGLYGTGKALKSGINEKYNKWFKEPYEDKAAGVQEIQDRIEQLKHERMAQKDYAYNLADSKYEPTRKAIHAVYGDPESWKL